MNQQPLHQPPTTNKTCHSQPSERHHLSVLYVSRVSLLIQESFRIYSNDSSPARTVMYWLNFVTKCNVPACSVLSVSPPESSLCFCLCGDRRVSVSRFSFSLQVAPREITSCALTCKHTPWRRRQKGPEEPQQQNGTSQTIFKAKSWSAPALRWTCFYSYYNWLWVHHSRQERSSTKPKENYHSVCDKRN